MKMTPQEIRSALVEKWSSDERPIFKGALIDRDHDDEVCMCAQGQALHYYGGYSFERLEEISREDADQAVAELLGISRFQACLLRIVNDREDGVPQSVLTDPEHVLGEYAQIILAFGQHMDRNMSVKEWDAALDAAWPAARSAARSAASEASSETLSKASWDAARDASWDASWAASWAVNEIQGHKLMEERGQKLLFLPMFGFSSVEEII